MAAGTECEDTADGTLAGGTGGVDTEEGGTLVVATEGVDTADGTSSGGTKGVVTAAGRHLVAGTEELLVETTVEQPEDGATFAGCADTRPTAFVTFSFAALSMMMDFVEGDTFEEGVRLLLNCCFLKKHGNW